MNEPPQTYTEPAEVLFRRWVERVIDGTVKQQVQNDRFWSDLRTLALDWQFLTGITDESPALKPPMPREVRALVEAIKNMNGCIAAPDGYLRPPCAEHFADAVDALLEFDLAALYAENVGSEPGKK